MSLLRELRRKPGALVLLAMGLGSLATGGGSEEQTCDTPEPVIRSLEDVVREIGASGGQPAPGSLAERLQSASKTANAFIRPAPESQAESDFLTERSRNLPEDSTGRRKLSRLQKLRQESWYPQIVDVRFVDDRMATVFVVYVPKPAQKAKVAETIDLLRQGDQWRVTLDPDADAAAAFGERGKRIVQTLRTACQKRLAELSGVVAEFLKEPVPFRGTWVTHFRQSSIYLTFNEQGEVFMLRTDATGGSSYALLDFHLAPDDKNEIVIETQLGSIRLRRNGDSYWEHDGQRHYGLIADKQPWFPEVDKPLHLKPVYKGDWPVRRPVRDTK